MKISLRTKLLLRLRPMLRFVKTRILHVNDSPERIAKGLAIGVFIAYLPVMGLQMMLAWITASLLKANRMVAVLGVWVSNAATAVFVYYPAYRLGRLILKMRPSKPELNPEQMDHLFDETLSLYRLLTEFHTQAFWKDVTSTAMNIGLEMLVRGVILGLSQRLGPLLYPCGFFLLPTTKKQAKKTTAP